MINWRYNRFGHVEIWNSDTIEAREADLYLQVDFDIRVFFNQQGLDVEDMETGETGRCEDPGYF